MPVERLGDRDRIDRRPAPPQHLLGDVGQPDVRPERRERRDDGVGRLPQVQGDSYIKFNAFDSTHGFETVVMSFIVNRPKVEPKIRMVRTEGDGRSIRYNHEVLR